MIKRLLSIAWLLAVIVGAFSAFGSLSSANASDVLTLGDVDGNGSVNVADITTLVNYLKAPSTTTINVAAADANHDGTVNAADEQAIANIILSGTPDQSANSVIFFSKASVETAFGEAFDNPVVRTGSQGGVTYSVAPAGVVTVNAATGEVTFVGVGTTTVTATLAADSQFKGATAQYSLKVTKNTSTDPDVVMTTEPEAKTSETGEGNQTCTGEEIPLITPGESAGGTIHYKVTTTNEPPSKDDDGWTTDIPTATDAGTYYIWYYTDGNDNSVATDVCQTPVTVTIDKAPAGTDPAETMTTEPEAKTTEGGGTPTYTGGAQQLITPGESNAGTVHYKVTTTNNPPSKSEAGWTTDVPTATDPGTYYVWYYADGNDNFEETAVSGTPITVTIDKAPATTDPAETMTTAPAAKTSEGGGNPTYTGTAQLLINPGESKAGGLKYKVTTTNEQPSKDDEGWSSELPTGTAAGTYYVWYYAEGNDKYEETAVCSTPITVTIDNATIGGVTATPYSGSYDGKPHGITVTAPSGATVKYGTTEGTYNLTESPAYTNAGSTTVYYQVAQPNYDTVTGSAMVTINKVALTATAAAKSREYGAANPALTVTVTGFVNGETAATAAGYTAPVAATTATATSAAGTYPITVSGGAATNYTFSYVSGTLTVNKPVSPGTGIEDFDDGGGDDDGSVTF